MDCSPQWQVLAITPVWLAWLCHTCVVGMAVSRLCGWHGRVTLVWLARLCHTRVAGMAVSRLWPQQVLAVTPGQRDKG